jgi:hypothetical protein
MTNLDTQCQTNIIPAEFYDKLQPRFKPTLSPLTTNTVLTTFDGAVSASQISGTVTIPLLLLAHISHKDSVVPQVFERTPDITAYVVSGVKEAFIGHPSLSDPASPFSTFNSMLANTELEIRFPRGPSRIQLPQLIPLASSSASGYAEVLHGAPHDAEAKSQFAQDHPGLDPHLFTPETLSQVRQWLEVTEIPQEFSSIKDAFAKVLYDYQDLFGPIPDVEDTKLPFLDMKVHPGTKPNTQGKARRCAPKHYDAALANIMKLHKAKLIKERTGEKLEPDFWYNALVYALKYDEFTGKPTGEIQLILPQNTTTTYGCTRDVKSRLCC